MANNSVLVAYKIIDLLIKKDLDYLCTSQKLVKMVYFAHGWYLGLTGKPLISDNVVAWRYGPIIINVLNHFQGNAYTDGNKNDLIVPLNDVSITFSEEVEDVINKVVDTYGNFSGIELSSLASESDTPWCDVYDPNSQVDIVEKENVYHKVYPTIPNDIIANYFKNKKLRSSLCT